MIKNKLGTLIRFKLPFFYPTHLKIGEVKFSSIICTWHLPYKGIIMKLTLLTKKRATPRQDCIGMALSVIYELLFLRAAFSRWF